MKHTHLWVLIQRWLNGQFFTVSQAQSAAKIGVSRSALSQWNSGQARPSPANLRNLHQITGIPYDQLLEALLYDMGSVVGGRGR